MALSCFQVMPDTDGGTSSNSGAAAARTNGAVAKSANNSRRVNCIIEP